ncbi:glycosyltransferase family 39 protein [Streptomyces albofaciens]|uniref:glycosyltransferase family 39 protein n=1 Tax=Streptomyces albofaciens TaxID=66866 RepID=UPI001239B416|nr:glycosyltransferase family 39 protein [Streptomyces albofaciens]
MLLTGLWGIRRQGSMWRDEAVTYDMAHRTLAELWPTLQTVDAVHGLYYVLMRGWFLVFDGGVVALRLPSVVAMAAAAAGVTLLGRQLAGRRAGLFAGLVFVLLPMVQQYAQEGRSYAMVCALVVWSTYLLARVAARPGRRLWAGYGALSLAACWMHEFAVLALPAHGAAVVLSGLPRAVRRAWCVVAGAVVVALVPLALFSMGQSEQLSWLQWPNPVQLGTFIALVLGGLICSRAPVGRAGARRLRLRPVALPLLVLPTALLVLLSQLKPMYVDRYVLYYVAGFALLAGAALDWVLRPAGHRGQTRRRLLYRSMALAVVPALLVPVNVFLRSPQSRTDDAVAVTRAVEELSSPGDGLLFLPSRRRVWAAADPHEFHRLRDLALDRSPVASHTLYGTELSGDRVHAHMMQARRIVAVGDAKGQPLDETDQEIAKRTTLRTAFQACATRELKGARVTLYARPGHC